jgi:hypothetical protein
MADIKKIKIGDTTYDIVDANAARKTYSNDTPIVTPVGSIKEGATFNNVSLQDMLTMILYPYIDIEVSDPVADMPVGAYTIPNYPTLNSVSIYVKKNSAKNLQFSLWDTTTNTQVGETLSESAISDNRMTFTGLNTTINTDRTFKIKYTYNGDGGEPVAEKQITVGSFSFTFTKPSNPTISSNLSKTSYYTGQTAEIKSITANVANINSASTHGITKMELYKGNSLASTSVANPGTSCTFTISDNITTNTTYKVKSYYKTRSATSTTYSDAVVENSYTISFTRKPATVSLSGVSGGTFSKLNPQSISSKAIKANFTKYSDSITSVKLLVDGSAKEEQKVSGYDSTTYSDSAGSATFDYSKTNTCTSFKLKAQAFNGTTAGVASSEISYTFFAPYCYGFVDESVSFSSVDRSTLAGLQSKKDSATTLIQEKSVGYKKFIYAIPNGNYKSAKDSAGNGDENFPLFENSENVANTKKEIEFADGSRVTYQILIFKEATGNNIDLYFR